MVIYNVTTKVDWSIADEWVQWMLDIHIPEVIGTGYFEKHQFVQLLEVEQEDGPTYAVQYFAASEQHYEHYLQQYAAAFSKESINKWGKKFIAFKSLMRVIG